MKAGATLQRFGGHRGDILPGFADCDGARAGTGPLSVVRHSDHNVWYRGVAAIGGVNPNVNSGHKRDDYRCAPDQSTADECLFQAC
jgi:hypothetical protein